MIWRSLESYNAGRSSNLSYPRIIFSIANLFDHTIRVRRSYRKVETGISKIAVPVILAQVHIASKFIHDCVCPTNYNTYTISKKGRIKRSPQLVCIEASHMIILCVHKSPVPCGYDSPYLSLHFPASEHLDIHEHRETFPCIDDASPRYECPPQCCTKQKSIKVTSVMASL